MSTTDGRPVALVTGASRGIGKAAALALAEAGFDVAITARTLRRGTGRDDSDVGDHQSVPGSLEETAAGIEDRRSRAQVHVADLLDHASLRAAVDGVLASWGRIDVLVNNAIYTGPGGMVPFSELTVGQLETRLSANVVSQVVHDQSRPPVDARSGARGVIVDVTSHVAVADPPAPVGQGGWGLGYAASKAAFHRVAGILAVELGDRGVRAYNLDPGYVDTERQLAKRSANGLAGHYRGAPPQRPRRGHRLAGHRAAGRGQRGDLRAQKVALDLGLHPDWRTPAPEGPGRAAGRRG